MLGSGIAFLDQTVVNVALPAIDHGLRAGLSGLQWIIDAYLLTLGSLLLVGGALGDRYGRRRLFSIGLIWFATASAACGLALTWELLAGARALQGIGAAMLVPGSLALLRGSFREEDQSQAIGIWAGFSGVTTAIGPPLGGWLIQAVSWRAVFLINLPLIVLALGAAARWLPESRDEPARSALDLPGAVTATGCLSGLVFALIEGARIGGAAPVVAAGAMGVACGAAFFVIESRSTHPMLPLAIFRSRRFSGANLTTLAVYFALSGALFLVVLELQMVRHESPLAAGAALMPITVLLLLLSPGAGRLSQRIGPRAPMTIGSAVAAVALLVLTRIAGGGSYVEDVLPGIVLLGLGLCAVVAPLTATALTAVEPRHAGIASGVNNAVARIAGLLAVAILPLVGRLGPGLANVGGFVVALQAAAAVCALGGLVAFVTMRPESPA